MARMGISYSDLPFDLIISACHHGCQCRSGSKWGEEGNDIDNEGYCQNWCSPGGFYCGHTKDYTGGIDCRGCNNNENDFGENVLYIKYERCTMI